MRNLIEEKSSEAAGETRGGRFFGAGGLVDRRQLPKFTVGAALRAATLNRYCKWHNMPIPSFAALMYL
ncbi:MAG: hypothetical protein WD795_11235 [Woeseia sp.]|jgi:hypothetical protein